MPENTPAPVNKNEVLKQNVPTLAGQIAATLADPAVDRFSEDDTQFTKFHGIYQQDDRDLRKTAKKYLMMIRSRIPGGVMTAKQWRVFDDLASNYGNNTLRVTTRQCIQFHGVVKSGLGPLIKQINESLLSTLAACGDVNRNVTASPTPATTKAREDVYADALRTAYALARADSSYGRPVPQDRVLFEEKAGLVPITLLRGDGEAISGARLASPQQLSVGADIPVELVASACSLAPDDILTAHHHPCIASCGAAFILAELKSRDALARAAARTDIFHNEIAKLPVTSILIYTQVNEAEIDIRARMFAPHHGIPEDPATGSANVALIGLLAKLRPERDLRLAKRIAQGVEMGRPSLLLAESEKANGAVTSTSVGGRCVHVMSGSIDVR